MRTHLFAFIIVSLALSGCSGVVYRADVQQGNEITNEMIAEVEPGMTQRNVTRILGYPLINDPFHKDRWDYFYSKIDGETGETTKQSITLIFSDGKLLELRNNHPQ